MIGISRKIYQRSGVETVVDSDGILQLNEKHIGKGLHHKTWVSTVKYPSDHRKHRYELVDEPKSNPTEFLETKN